VSVVIPARNEERYLGECLESVIASLAPVGPSEILVVDGESDDGTGALVARYQARHPAIRRLPNPKRITAAAFNLGIRASASSAIAIVSAHSRLEPGFFEAALRRLDRFDADIVGGPVRTEALGSGAMAWLLGRIVSHPFGVGNSSFRVSQTESYVDAVPFAVFRRDVFERVGLFDESLVRNQDTDFFGRVRRAGLRVLLDPQVRSVYRPRSTLGGLLRQGFRNAYWNVLVWRRNPSAFQLRHAVPAAFALSLIVGLVLAAAVPFGPVALALVLGGYLMAATLAAIDIFRRTRRPLALLLPPLFLLYHVSYGVGSLVGLKWLVARPTQGAGAERL
jgi:glycosyltransferase involved in cell wall biosynthesis